MDLRNDFTSIIAALVVIAVGSPTNAEPLRIGYLTWVGNGPFFVAREKGLFAEQGIEVELIDMAVHEALYAGLFAGQVDAIGATVDDMLPNFDEADPYVCVMALDDDRGGSGILATNDIQSIADLEGKVVGRAERTVSQFFLNVLLRDAGLSEADIEPVEMSADDAGTAFLMQEIDAAVTWEPFLTRARQSEHGHVLADSSEMPGLIVDCLVAKTDVFNGRLADFKALARAWDAALAYVAAHPEKSNEIMAQSVGGWLEDPAAFAEALKGVRFYDSERNREYFGTPEQPGQIYQTMQYAIDVWTELGLLKTKLVPADAIAHGIFEE
ncbi:MAG TPA: ABC transporter substrate-binding protein [Geminicoccaceae bacterium]